MKSKAVIPLILGLCVGLLAVKLGLDAVQNAQASSTKSETIGAVRAVRNIDAFEELRAEMLEEIQTEPTSLFPAAELTNTVENLVGRVTASPIMEGSPILASALSAEGTAPGLQGSIPSGFRAVSVKIDEVTGVAYQVKPGDWVDVIVVMDVKTGERNRLIETIAEVILQNVQVASVGMSTPGKSGETGSAKVQVAKSATLFVRNADVPKLHLASSRGRITLALRGADDLVSAEGAYARSDELLRSLLRDAEADENENGSGSAGPIADAAPQPPAVPLAQRGPDLRHNVIVVRDTTQLETLREVERVAFATASSRQVVGVSKGNIAQTGSNENELERAGDSGPTADELTTNQPTGNN